jgi:hypothetical protein
MLFETILVGSGVLLIAKALVDRSKKLKRSLDVRHGYETEYAIAWKVARCGGKAKVSPRSRGPADVRVEWPRGPDWRIQSKASREGLPRPPGPRERARLRAAAARAKSIPVIALSSGSRTLFYSEKTGERLYPPCGGPGR